MIQIARILETMPIWYDDNSIELPNNSWKRWMRLRFTIFTI